MTDAETVIPQFGHYVNLASTLGALPWGLVMTIRLLVLHSLILKICFRLTMNRYIKKVCDDNQAFSLTTKYYLLRKTVFYNSGKSHYVGQVNLEFCFFCQTFIHTCVVLDDRICTRYYLEMYLFVKLSNRDSRDKHC